MGKAINALVDSVDLESESNTGTKLVFLDFKIPKTGCREKYIQKKNARVPHERITTEVREVKYLRDGFVKEEGDLKPRKIVLETHGFEIVKELLVPRGQFSVTELKVVGSVTRDLKSKESHDS